MMQNCGYKNPYEDVSSSATTKSTRHLVAASASRVSIVANGNPKRNANSK
ncbi:MAG: hypothetical protein V7K67_15325 [Nostoc sp.]